MLHGCLSVMAAKLEVTSQTYRKKKPTLETFGLPHFRLFSWHGTSGHTGLIEISENINITEL